MRLRQNGSDAMKVVEAIPQPHMQELAIRAFELPRFDTENLKQEAINDFRNQSYVECVRSKSFR